jgi:hypothetical protein
MHEDEGLCLRVLNERIGDERLDWEVKIL